MKYIKNFENHTEYEAFTGTTAFIKPNVSLCKQENEVHYNPSSPVPPTPSHDYVEIAGIKWATMNVGATSITDYGLFFQWGDTQGYTADQVGSGEGQKYFGWADYKYNSGGTSPSAADMTKYNSTDSKTVLEESDDAAQVNWGGQWRMPTTAEFAALGTAVNTAWTADYQGSGVAGMVCTDKTDSSKVLFFPAAGLCSNGSVNVVGSNGYYWCSSLSTGDMTNGRNLYFNNGGVNWHSLNIRCFGLSVRCVVGYLTKLTFVST